jgi:hypothetical protein
LITNQTQVLLAIGESLELLRNHGFGGPYLRNFRTLTNPNRRKLRWPGEQREGAEALSLLERQIATGMVDIAALRSDCPWARTGGDSNGVDSGHHRHRGDEEGEARKSNRRLPDMGSENLEGDGMETDAGDDRESVIKDEELPDRSETPDGNDDDDQPALNLLPTANVFFVVRLLFEGLRYPPVHCSQRSFSRIQGYFGPSRYAQGKASCATALSEITEVDYLGFDGA